MLNILSAIVFFAFGTCVVISQDVRWSHICPHEIKILTCPVGTTVEVTGIFLAARRLGCPDNRTDPVKNLANCSSRKTSDVLKGQDTSYVTDCHGSNVCAVKSPPLTNFAVCGKVILANFSLVSYRCHPGPSTAPESSSPISPTGNTNGNDSSNIPVSTPVTPTSAMVKSGSTNNLTIPLAAGWGGSVLIIIVIFLVIFYKTRKSGNGNNRKLTAQQMKEPGRPDVTIDTLTADGAYVNYNPSETDPRKLYAVLDKGGQSEDLAVVPMYSQLENLPKTETKAAKGGINFSDTAEDQTVDPTKIYENTN